MKLDTCVIFIAYYLEHHQVICSLIYQTNRRTQHSPINYTLTIINLHKKKHEPQSRIQEAVIL